MSKFSLVFQHELKTLVLRKSFLLLLILVPLLPFVTLTVLSRFGAERSSAVFEELFVPSEEVMFVGFVDQSGLVQQIPGELQETLLSYESEALAEVAVAAEDIQFYYVIAADYIESGQVKKYGGLSGILGEADSMNRIGDLIEFNLLEGDMTAFERLRAPMVVEEQLLSDEPQRDPDAAMSFFLPYVITMLFYFVIFGNASLLLRSVTKEKENCMLEGLLTSLRPFDLIAGKIAAGGLAGLLQTSFWLACGFGLLRMSGQQFGLSEAFVLPTFTIVWGAVFFLLGYAIYASLMAGVGAVVPNIKEATQFSLLVSAPLIACMMLFSAIIDNPGSTLALVLSLFPMTSPVIMMTRLASGTVPLWQLLLAVGLMMVTVVWIIVSVTRLFHAQIMLAGSPLKLKRFIKAFIGKA